MFRILIASFLLCFISLSIAQSHSKVLEEYVSRPDPDFSYTLNSTFPFTVNTLNSTFPFPGQAYLLNVTYSTWWSKDQTPFNKWWNWVLILKPSTVSHRVGLLNIVGGSFGTRAPTSAPTEFAMIATTTQSIVAIVQQIPNQGISFEGQTRTRVEDDLIAYTWRRFMETGKTNWIAQLPMVKGSVKAMDSIKDYLGKAHSTVIEKFVVVGASKRGWTTWLVAAARSRDVAAIIPIVIPILKTKITMQHIYRSYCFWPAALRDYENEQITKLLYTQMLQNLTDIVDPLNYREVLTMPKYIISATGDQFFAPDTIDFFYKDLLGETLLRDIPNADHSLRGTDALFGVAAFYHSILNNFPRPSFSWSNRVSGEFATLTVTSKDKPISAKLWVATNPNARDFRVEIVGNIWSSTDIQDTGNGNFQVRVPIPAGTAYTAYNIELKFPSRTITPMVFSTSTYIIPERLPCTNP